jgi:phosphoribosyl-ATP pyrophosphohydrolase
MQKSEIKENTENITEKVLHEINEEEKESLVAIISSLKKYLSSSTEMSDLLYLNAFLKKQTKLIQILEDFNKKIN